MTNQGGGEKCPHLRMYFERHLSGIDNKLDKGYERKRAVKDKIKVLGLSNQANRV